MMSINTLNAAENAVWSLRASHLGSLARWALEQEARLSPKPAMVDSRGTGAHGDMNLALMLNSARCLEPWFAQMAEAGLNLRSDSELRCTIGQLGRKAETDMLTTTGGINTHRGAIWALGLLVTAAATSPNSEKALFDRSAQLARLPDPMAPAINVYSNGQKVYHEYRLPGAREQAQLGFPHIRHHSLPMLRQSRMRGDSESVARLNALLAIMSELTDTCVISRAGLAGLTAMQKGARAVLDAGGCGSFTGHRALAQLEFKLLALNASAGGAADLLAATLLIDRLLDDALV